MTSLKIPRREALSGLSVARDFFERRSSIGVLRHCRLLASGAVVTIETTNLDSVCLHEMDCELEGVESLQILLPLVVLERCARSGDGDLVITPRDEGVVELSCGDLSVHIPGGLTLPITDWPDFLGEHRDKKIESTVARAGDLHELLSVLRPSVSREETRYYLNGYYLHRDGDEFLTGTSTDGHRMAIHRSPIVWPLADLILPREFARLLERHLDRWDQDGEVEIWSIPPSGMRLGFRFGRTTLLTKCIDGTYPNYRRVLPNPSGNIQARIPARAVVGMPRGEKGESVLLSVHPSEGVVRHRSNDGIVFTSPIPTVKSPSFGVNLRYLRAFMPRRGEVVIVYENGGDPLKIVVPGQERTTRIVMPMRI